MMTSQLSYLIDDAFKIAKESNDIRFPVYKMINDSEVAWKAIRYCPIHVKAKNDANEARKRYETAKYSYNTTENIEEIYEEYKALERLDEPDKRKEHLANLMMMRCGEAFNNPCISRGYQRYRELNLFVNIAKAAEAIGNTRVMEAAIEASYHAAAAVKASKDVTVAAAADVATVFATTDESEILKWRPYENPSSITTKTATTSFQDATAKMFGALMKLLDAVKATETKGVYSTATDAIAVSPQDIYRAYTNMLNGFYRDEEYANYLMYYQNLPTADFPIIWSYKPYENPVYLIL